MDRQTDIQTQTDFIICPMLDAIAMGQIKIKKDRKKIKVLKAFPINVGRPNYTVW